MDMVESKKGYNKVNVYFFKSVCIIWLNAGVEIVAVYQHDVHHKEEFFHSLVATGT